MRGRRPKPTRIKALTGNPGKRHFTNQGPCPRYRIALLSSAQSPGRNGLACLPSSRS